MQKERSGTSEAHDDNSYTSLSAPSISLPKGGGAIRGIDEQFKVNAVNGSSGVSIGLPFSPSRNGFMPAAGLSYNSGGGNGVFGLGWQGDVEAVCRRTDKRLPLYQDEHDSDIFGFSGGEELVPAYDADASGQWIRRQHMEGDASVTAYRPRTESAFARVEKIAERDGTVYWRMTTAANVVSVYGKSAAARLSDPADPSRVFKWLLEFNYDDKGNCYRYEYKQEDLRNVARELHEQGRLEGLASFTNLYLKRVKYCNAVHFDRTGIDLVYWDAYMAGIDYLLEMVFDYGEHDVSDPQPDDDRGWGCRADAFSSYKSGFEIRTYRLCKRVLMFHRFAELGTKPCLVKSLDLQYESSRAFSQLMSATMKGYIRKADGSYSMKAMPPVTYTYEPLGWDTEVRTLSSDVMADLPVGVDGRQYRWVDLYKEGISGILSEQDGGWYYKDNFGDGQLGGMRPVASKPALTGLNKGALQLQDITGGGQQFVVSQGLEGYYELGSDNEWMSFRHFDNTVNVDMRDPNIRLLDLNGDGRADILLTGDEVFTWHASKGRAGYEMYQQVQKPLDEKRGPSLVFADVTESIMLADMSGDGLADIVRIRYDEICYWPNLGYGRFGAMVSMSDAPVLDTEEGFEPRRVLLSDIDGSGVASMVYTGGDQFVVFFNQAGNGWSEAKKVEGGNTLVQVQVIDLLGSGTGCIVWSSGLPQDGNAPLQYIDLMGGKKPYVMKGYVNNMGGEVVFSYKSSTYFYLQDKLAGRPWVTKLPFPVQCVDRITAIDHVRNTSYANVFSYHHGYYDPVEREFRGFGRVDTIDTDRIDDLTEPPVLKKTWYHTGVFTGKDKVLSAYAAEYFGDGMEKVLDEPVLPEGLSDEEWREALRACRGSVLRSEVYSLDGSEQQGIPYSTMNNGYGVRVLQPRVSGASGVFMVLPAEALTYDYERTLSDPRISHAAPLSFDVFGNVLESVKINYGRRQADPALTAEEQAEQGKTHIVYTKKAFTNAVDTLTDHRLPMGSEMMIWELTGAVPSGVYFSVDEIRSGFEKAEEIGFEIAATAGIVQKRLLQQTKALMWRDDMSGPLALGVMQPLGLLYQSYKLSMTASLRDDIYGDKVSDQLLVDEGRYVHFDDGNYWVCSALPTLDAAHFYQATAMIDPFGFGVKIEYDEAYRLFVTKTTDQLGNEAVVLGFDYRILQPWMSMDANDNRTAVRTDELGMVVCSFILGKEPLQEGDLFDASSPGVSAADRPSSAMEYDLSNYMLTGKPNFSVTTVRERYYYDDLATASEPVFRKSYTYIDGSGATIMKKVQADPGLAWQRQADGTYQEVDTTPALRWMGNGRTIVNSKGQPVKQYDPYFSVTPGFEDASELVERGVSPIITYDAAGRSVRTDMPDGTYTTSIYNNWTQRVYDQGDNVIDSLWYKRRTDPTASAEDAAAAVKSAAYSGTPKVVHLDSLGRGWISVADIGQDGQYKTRSLIDISNYLRGIVDQMGRMLVTYKYDMLGVQLYQNTMDSGEQWLANDVMGKPLRNWDSRGNIMSYETDGLHRPVRMMVRDGDGKSTNTEYIVYGETLPDAKQRNLRGMAYKHYDAAGMSVYNQIDLAGNQVDTQVQLLQQYGSDPDWTVQTEADLSAEIFQTVTTFDALKRVTQVRLAGDNTVRPVYNATGVLEQVYVSVKGLPEALYVKDINYNARGQRINIIYGNNVVTKYAYDETSHRLTSITTTGNGKVLQQLTYTYDAMGNVSFSKDAAQPDVYFNNDSVKAENDYLYDALYRLTQASGREQAGQNVISEGSSGGNNRNYPFVNGANPDDMNAMRRYVQKYAYDPVGNIQTMQHVAGVGSYTRAYQYDDKSNRLLQTTAGNTVIKYNYDVHGNMLDLPQAAGLIWNYKEELRSLDLGGGGAAYYMYGAGGSRVRKVVERTGGMREERLYLGVFELYRKYDSTGMVQEETETLHLMDGQQRVGMTETKTIEDGVVKTADSRTPLIRYQHQNLIGSSAMELDGTGVMISYEEYHPYGTTSTVFTGKDVQAAAKRYRYLGLERDEETGMGYHGARYYLPWLARWLSPDPSYYKDSFNVYQYARCNPVVLVDINGRDSRRPEEWERVLLDVAKDVIYKLHRDEGSAGLSGDEKAVYDVFVSYGRSMLQHGDVKVSDLQAFYATAIPLSRTYGVSGEWAQSAHEGDVAHEKRLAADISMREEHWMEGSRLRVGVVHETTAQYKQHIEDRMNNKNLFPVALGNLMAAGYAAPGSASAGMGARPGMPVEMHWGAPTEAVREAPVADSHTQVGVVNAKGEFFEGSYEKIWPSTDASKAIVDAGSDPAGAHAFSVANGTKVVEALPSGSNVLQGVTELTVQGHSDGKTMQLFGRWITPKQLALYLADAGFDGGKVTLISCDTGNPVMGNEMTSFATELHTAFKSLGIETTIRAPIERAGTPTGGPNYGKPLVNDGFQKRNAKDQTYLPQGQGWIEIR